MKLDTRASDGKKLKVFSGFLIARLAFLVWMNFSTNICKMSCDSGKVPCPRISLVYLLSLKIFENQCVKHRKP